MVDRAHRGALVLLGGVLLVVAGTFLPWLRSGSRSRSSYELFDLVERLGFAPGGPVAWALRLWPLVPLFAVLTVITGWAVVERRAAWSWLACIGFVLVAWVGGTALAIARAPDVGLFRIGIGPWVTTAGAAVVTVAVGTLRRRGSGSSEAS